MTWEQLLADCANAAQILTAGAAVFFSARAALQARNRRAQLEEYLKAVRQRERPLGRQGALTDVRLSADLGMTTDQVREAAFLSRKIKRFAVFDPETRRASGILFQFQDKYL